MNAHAHDSVPQAPTPKLRHFRARSVQTGAFQLIPFPFVDDWLINRTRRSLVAQALRERGLTYDPKVPDILTHWTSRTFADRARSAASSLVKKPLRKAFRTVFFWLALTRAVRSTAETFFLGRFVQHPDLTKPLSTNHLGEDRAREFAAIFERSVDRMNRRLAGDAGRRIWRKLRSEHEHDASEIEAEEVGRALDEEAPGILTDFHREVSAAMETLTDASQNASDRAHGS